MNNCTVCKKAICQKNMSRHVASHAAKMLKFGCQTCEPTIWFQTMNNYETHFRKFHEKLLKPGPKPTKKPPPPEEVWVDNPAAVKPKKSAKKSPTFETIYI